MSNDTDPTLDQLHKRMKKRFPEALVAIRKHRKWYERTLPGFARDKDEKNQLRRLALTAPDKLPVYVLGDETIANCIVLLRENFHAQRKADTYST
ncbi:hypothetical protein FEE96_09535 [Parasedimentitalea maritima]|uniref:Uncharacterized protein n=1 Tax=Parasedimentitalea maritima TaxID=2578117 RepID=A0ABY2UVR4_9RHOB|nr:hypothetical protein [Zongyanglinia marina]TLP65734.1 hypothetical protein FEE96_09535 [Zongyanglinia marina]